MNFLSLNVRGLGGLDKKGWVKNLRSKHGIHFVAFQETKKDSVRVSDVAGFWGNKKFGMDSVDSVGFSGGMICLFCIFDSWFDKPGFEEEFVKVLKKESVSGGPSDVALMKKLCDLRVNIKKWRDDMLKKNSEEVASALSDMEDIQTIMEERDLTEEDEWILLESNKVLKEEEEQKSRDLKQRSRLRWAKEGDKNSKFFHAMINCRKASNFIHGLEVEGTWVSKPSLIKKEVYRFFRKKFVEDCIYRPRLSCPDIKRISDADSSFPDARFSREEIKGAVFECGDDRAPDPDNFYEHGAINTGCGSSFIAMIPKVRDPIGLKDYRLISLLGIVYKVISKILANRLKRALDSIISESQSAFISGRYILDGPLIVNEVQNWIKRVKKKAFILKIDFEKAYDNINWNFVLDILAQMGFSDKWCLWIKGVITSARASILVNGAPTSEFKCHKGMRQGDPISPFLFFIVMEALSCMISKACSLGIVKGVSLPNSGPVVSHLLSTDDAIILGEWSKDNILNAVRILRCFYACSGLQINFTKSNLFGIGLQLGEVEDMAVLVGCKAESLPFKYLG
ncbi:uncharacterized protein LOC110888201 [Helianthus annuus]|uniref:uncharacterized protein LOC110888201 n=1 Tax=Helianthus annuus TaxID=4232 RepID=UPI000B8F2E50|nr:uncharacterized protein LOC110888201 [Helianthus annuus]